MDDRDALFATLNAADNEIDRLRQQVADLQQQVRDRDLIIRQARDITPVLRPNFARVLALVRAACLDISKIPKTEGGGWLLSMGSLRRKFKFLRQIWDLLVVGDWFLADLFDEPVVTVKKIIKKVPWGKFKPVFSLETVSFDINGLILDGSLDRLEFDVPFG